MTTQSYSAQEEDKERLAAENLAYAAQLAFCFHQKHPYLDACELFSAAASLGLREALEKYDPSRGASFKSYLHTLILFRLKDVQKDYLNRQRYIFIPLDAEINEEGKSLLDRLKDGSPLPNSTSQDIHSWIMEQVNSLPPKKREILSLCFGLNGAPEKSEKQIAAEKGITPAGVNDAKMRALHSLRKKINCEQIRMHL